MRVIDRVKPRLLALALCCAAPVGITAAAPNSPATHDVATSSPAGAPATQPPLPEPTRITLTLEDATIQDALRRLLEAAQLPAQDPLDPQAARMLEGVNVSATIVDQPFVLAMIEICRQAGLEPIFTGNPARPVAFMVRNPPPRGFTPHHSHPATTRPTAATRATTRATTTRAATRPPPVVIPRAPAHRNPTWLDGPMTASGPFVIVPQSATRTSSANLETGESARELRLNLTVIPDPALRLFGLAPQLTVDTATDDAGQSLLAPGDPQQRTARPLERLGPMLAVAVPLRYPDRPRGTLATLRGQLNFTHVTRFEPVEILKDAQAVPGELTAGPMRFTIGPAQETGDGMQLPIKITQPFNGTNAWDEIRATARGDHFRVSDPSGATYIVETHIHSVLSDCYQGTIHVRLPHGPWPRDLKAPKTPARMVWEVPIELTDLSLPIELGKLPLP